MFKNVKTKTVFTIMINKSIKETHNITYNRSYLLFKKNQKEEWITGGEAISILLKRIKIEKTYVKNIKLINKFKSIKKLNDILKIIIRIIERKYFNSKCKKNRRKSEPD